MDFAAAAAQGIMGVAEKPCSAAGLSWLRRILVTGREQPGLDYRGHIAGLDVLRGTAVLAVVLHHAYYNTLDTQHWHGLAALWIALTGLGHLGVHLFFVLSGFLITGILLDSKNAATSGTTAGAIPHPALRFYARRARRILPAYLVVLAILRLTHLVDWRFVLASLFFVVNMGRLVGARLPQFSSLWSLAVEEQFYLVWPWILWRCRPGTVWRIMMAGLLLPPVFRFGLSAIGQDSYYKTWVNVDYLMYGAVIAFALRSGALHGGNIGRITRWLYIASVAGMALSLLIWALAHGQVWALALFNAAGRSPEMLLFVAMLLSALIAHQAPKPAPAIWQMPRRALIFLGYISYGLYLVHMIVFRLYDRYAAGTLLGGYEHSFALLTLRAALCSTASILIAWLSRETLEAWFLRQNTPRTRAIHTAPLPTALQLPPHE